MDKLLDKVEPGCPEQPPEGAAEKPESKNATLLSVVWEGLYCWPPGSLGSGLGAGGRVHAQWPSLMAPVFVF